MERLNEMVKKYNNDLEGLNRELKRLQSVKCRLQKQRGKATYEEEMAKALAQINDIQTVKRLLTCKEKSVPQYEQEDIDKLDYDQTQKAIKSIQSKKYLTRWLTTEEGDNDEFRNACRIEQMLQKHKQECQPVDAAYVRKSQIEAMIEAIEDVGEVSTEKILEMLKELL